MHRLIARLDRAPEWARALVCLANVAALWLLALLVAGCRGRGVETWLP